MNSDRTVQTEDALQDIGPVSDLGPYMNMEVDNSIIAWGEKEKKKNLIWATFSLKSECSLYQADPFQANSLVSVALSFGGRR